MATKIVMEALSPTMEEGRVASWKKKEGDAVKSGDVLAEVETDKAVMDLVARGDGTVRSIVVPEGQTVAVGTLLGVIGAAGEDVSGLAGNRESPIANREAPTPEPMKAKVVAVETTPAPSTQHPAPYLKLSLGKPTRSGSALRRASIFWMRRVLTRPDSRGSTR